RSGIARSAGWARSTTSPTPRCSSRPMRRRMSTASPSSSTVGCGCAQRASSARSKPMTARPAWAVGVCAGLYAAGSRDVVYVPDNPQSHVLAEIGEQYGDVRLLLATRQEEAFGIAAGLYLGGRRPTVMLQSSGLGNSLNAITSLVLPYQIPMLIVVSMRGDGGEWNAAQMPMGRAVRGILDAI